MGFGGSVSAMIASLKANDAQRSKRRTSYKENGQYKSSYGKLVDHKKMSPSDFAAFKEKLLQEKKVEQRKNILLLIISGIILLLLITGVYFYFEG